jgi:hypothetical protein
VEKSIQMRHWSCRQKTPVPKRARKYLLRDEVKDFERLLQPCSRWAEKGAWLSALMRKKYPANCDATKEVHAAIDHMRPSFFSVGAEREHYRKRRASPSAVTGNCVKWLRGVTVWSQVGRT